MPITKNDAQIINDLAARVHAGNRRAGWWYMEPEHPMSKFEVGTKLALIHSEVSEALEGFRTDAMDEKLPHRKEVEVELGDTVIRILDLAGFLGLDLGGAMREKEQYNAQRSDHKPSVRASAGGKKF